MLNTRVIIISNPYYNLRALVLETLKSEEVFIKILSIKNTVVLLQIYFIYSILDVKLRPLLEFLSKNIKWI